MPITVGGTRHAMLSPQRGTRGKLASFRITPEQAELEARAESEGVTHTVIVAQEWRTFRRAMEEQLTITRATRAVRAQHIPHLLNAWPRGTGYTRPDHLRSRAVATLGHRDDLAVRLSKSPDLPLMALAWGIHITHCYLDLIGRETNLLDDDTYTAATIAAAQLAGIIP